MTYRSASVRARVFDDALREAMEAPFTESHGVEVLPAADPAAGTVSPETDPSEMLRNRSIVDEDADRSYRHGVQHASESARLARLRLWQAQR